MEWTDLHATLLGRAIERLLGEVAPGTMAYVRCLTPDVVRQLAKTPSFAPRGWTVRRVAAVSDDSIRTITADCAVEIREAKDQATLLLVDTLEAGAGMDGIYSAARHVDETTLFKETLRLAKHEVTRVLSSQDRSYAEQAIKKARGHGRRYSVSPWAEFDFLARIAASGTHPGRLLYLIGLWPIEVLEGHPNTDDLNISRMFVERLLGTAASGLTPARRIEALRLLKPSDYQVRELEHFLRLAATKPLMPALSDLADKSCLWVNALQLEGTAQDIQGIELILWRNNTGRIAKWSGLVEEGGPDKPPVLVLNPDAEKTGDYSKLEVKWQTRPENLEKDTVEYRVAVVTDMGEELAYKEVSHSAKNEQRCKFTNDDFSTLSDDSLIPATVTVSVIGKPIDPQTSEDFIIRFGQPREQAKGGVGKTVRALSEGLVELESRDMVCAVASFGDSAFIDTKGSFVFMRIPQKGKSFRVFRAPLVQEVERQWVENAGAIGRWTVKVRASGTRAGKVEFVPFSRPTSLSGTWDRAANASRKMAERFGACAGGVGQVYDDQSKVFDGVVKEYLLGWAALLEEGKPSLALANTVEVQSLSGRTIGLIVLPNHPLRVAWHVAYDNLVLHARFVENMTPKEIREEFASLDGAMVPAFLPSPERGSFVFGDTIGFHTVGMVLDSDKEPKAAIAILTRALGESEATDTAPTVGRQSAEVLGSEILKYLACHDTSRLLHIHALRPGDGLTVARALGHVQKWYHRVPEDDGVVEDDPQKTPFFVLELYPSQEQQERGIAGRFMAEVREKRRSGAGTLSSEDYWMLESESLPGGVNLPRLRWARKDGEDPRNSAHVAVAFDTFESRVVPSNQSFLLDKRPLHAFGLSTFFQRSYSSLPSPMWQSTAFAPTDGEKHPSDRSHTERLVRLHKAVQKCVSRALGTESDTPTLLTEISPDKAQNLKTIHRLCDWVITLDRNAGIEYFDSPRDNGQIYDAYVIDCVPEREDLGCLQLITSTSNLEEVRTLLDGALDQMGLSQSLKNAEFLLTHLKALSGRLAIRLTGQKAPTAELIALALCQAYCWRAPDDSDCWTPLRNGFFVPVDDVRDLLPPLNTRPAREEDTDRTAARPDLIYVSSLPRKGLLFRFIEVKYRRHLRDARNPEELHSVRRQVESLREKWEEWYLTQEVCSSARAIRRAKLARVLRFYADKARRHADDEHKRGVSREIYETLVAEIDRMIEKGADYAFAGLPRPDRGWVFCPEYAGSNPLLVSPENWDTRIFLFGPAFLPDIAFPIGPVDNFANEISVPTGPPYEGDDGRTVRQSVGAPEPVAGEGQTDMGQGLTGISGSLAEDVPAICLGTDTLNGTEVVWPLTIKGNPHLLMAGLPGMGKTTCLLNLCIQMLKAGIWPIVFSYHQDIDERLEQLVKDVRFVDFHGLGFNPLRVMDRESRLGYLDVAGSLRDIFLAIFPDLGSIQGEEIRQAIKQSFAEMGWDDPNASLENLSEPLFGRFIEILRAKPKPDKSLRTLLVRLEGLADYGFFDPAEFGENLWDCDAPTVIRVHSTQDESLQKAFASLVFYSLYKDMFRRGVKDRITHTIIFDEAHRAAGLKLIPTMAKECRKYGISLVLASQEAKDFHVSLFSAIANYLVLRLTEIDAKALVRNVANSQQERVLIDKIKQMERFRALYFWEGKAKPFSVALSP